MFAKSFSVDRGRSSLREAQELAQCARQLCGGRTEIQIQIHLTRALAINSGVRFSILRRLAGGWTWTIAALLISTSRAPGGPGLMPTPTLPFSQACLGVHRYPMETPQIPPPHPPATHTHRVLHIILPREKSGDKGRSPLELVLDWLWGQLTISSLTS